MSILLDALRKSEQQQKLGNVPDIHSVDPVGIGNARPPWLLPLAAVLLLALVVGGSFLAWRWINPAAAPASNEQAGRFGQKAGPVVAKSASRDDRSGNPAPDAIPRAASTRATAEPESNPAAPTRQPRSPVETLSGDRPYRPALASGAPSASPDEEEQTSARTARERIPSGAQPLPDTTSIPGFGVATPADRRRSEDTSAANPAPTARSTSGQDNEAGLISYWQLPPGTRENLPAFRINVLVFDADPDRRFILMDGKRYQIGDSPRKNLRLLNIERGRVVWRYGIYRFYVNQGS